MKKVFKANCFFFGLLLWMIIGIFPLRQIVILFNIRDLGALLLLQHGTLIVLPAIIYLIISKERVKNVLRLNKLSFKQILLVILIGIFSQPIMSLFSFIAGLFVKNDVSEALYTMADKPYFLILSIVALLPSISEELVIRGIVLNGYRNKNRYLAAIVTGIMFGMFHLNYHQFLYAAFMGIILSLVVIITDSIFASALIHFITNGLSATLIKISSLIKVPETSEVTTLSFRENLATLCFIAAIALICALILKRLFNKLEKVSNYEEEIIEEEKKERVINIPFTGSLIVFVIYMIII